MSPDVVFNSGVVTFSTDDQLTGEIVKDKEKQPIKRFQIYFDNFEEEELRQLLSKAGIPQNKGMKKDQLVEIMKKNAYKGGKLDVLLKIPIIKSI